MAVNFESCWAVVVAQLVERSLPIPEVRGSNPVIGKIRLVQTSTASISVEIFSMSGFEPWTSGIGSDRSTN